ncbi:MAG: pyridoxine 5'-phosphate synthase [Ottowia sp.]
MTRLSVNLNKVALVRNTRHLGLPDLVRAARQCLQAGAHGITVHPRPDGRHIRPPDVAALAAELRAWPDCEYNIEGNPLQNLMEHVRAQRPQQATFVPDAENQFTSDHGFDLTRPDICRQLAPLIAECRALGVRVSLFMDALPEQMPQARALGAERVELYTEPYAAAFAAARAGGGDAPLQAELARYASAARAAQAQGLQVNAGHDLNLQNLPAFLRAVPGVAEVSIGHAFIADALEMGYAQATRAYLQAMAV